MIRLLTITSLMTQTLGYDALHRQLLTTALTFTSCAAVPVLDHGEPEAKTVGLSSS